MLLIPHTKHNKINWEEEKMEEKGKKEEWKKQKAIKL